MANHDNRCECGNQMALDCSNDMCGSCCDDSTCPKHGESDSGPSSGCVVGDCESAPENRCRDCDKRLCEDHSLDCSGNDDRGEEFLCDNCDEEYERCDECDCILTENLTNPPDRCWEHQFDDLEDIKGPKENWKPVE